jgi:hypothetical protein
MYNCTFVESSIFYMYDFKNNVVNEAKTPGLKCLLMHGSMTNAVHEQQQLVS